MNYKFYTRDEAITFLNEHDFKYYVPRIAKDRQYYEIYMTVNGKIDVCYIMSIDGNGGIYSKKVFYNHTIAHRFNTPEIGEKQYRLSCLQQKYDEVGLTPEELEEINNLYDELD